MINFIFKPRPKLAGRVSILIPTILDSRYIIELCLESIKKNTDYPDYRIIVCDSGVDNTTYAYLSGLAKNNEIKLIKATDRQRPKDDLVKAVDTEYYVLMHDDIKILKPDWLTNRMSLIKRDQKNAIIGSTVRNLFNHKKRFFPLGLLVRTDISRKLDLKWGKQPEYDTGALAYETFFSQKEFKFITYRFSKDIYHFSEMGWTIRKEKDGEYCPGLENKLEARTNKIKQILEILRKKDY